MCCWRSLRTVSSTLFGQIELQCEQQNYATMKGPERFGWLFSNIDRWRHGYQRGKKKWQEIWPWSNIGCSRNLRSFTEEEIRTWGYPFEFWTARYPTHVQVQKVFDFSEITEVPTPTIVFLQMCQFGSTFRTFSLDLISSSCIRDDGS